jgi:hypothetical protein
MVTFDAGTFTILGGNVVVVAAGTVVVVAGVVVVVAGRVVEVTATVVVVTTGIVVVGVGRVVGVELFAEAAFDALVQPASSASATGATTNRQADRMERCEVFTKVRDPKGTGADRRHGDCSATNCQATQHP